ncbi:MAG TPA: hypothetical protein VFR83_07735, partial [Burkholderiales bacterium]|nr:hypothetical protein [Burkholderiales bacterium]
RILWLSLIPPAGRAGGLVPFLEGMAGQGYGVGAFGLDECWGDNSCEMPIELPNTVELVVNLKSAQALGITIPPSILLRADRVIV